MKYFFIIFIPALFLYSVEAVIYPGVVHNNLKLNPLLFFAPSLLLLIYLSISRKISPKITKLLYIATLVILHAGVVLELLDRLFHANFVFSTVHIHPLHVLSIGVVLSVFTLIMINQDFIRTHKKLFFILLPFWLYSLMFIFKIHFEEAYYQIRKEDSLVEYLTMLGYLFIVYPTIKSFTIIKNSSSIKKLTIFVYAGAFLIIGIGSFIIAGEEISWAQRIIGFDTPEALVDRNAQNEFNFHNDALVAGLIYYGYWLVAFYGVTANVLTKIIAGIFTNTKIVRKFFHLFSPPIEAVGFFIPMLIFATLRLYYGNVYPLFQWEEFTELLLAIGLAILFYTSYKSVLKHKTSLKKLLE